MYEPKYYPQLTETLHVFSDMRFLVTHTKRYRRFDDSNTDPLHVHNYLEIFLNVSSDVSFLVNNSLYPVGAGDVVVSRPGDIHKGVFHKSQVVENVCLWIDADFHSAPFSFLWKKEFCVLLSFSEEEKQRFQSLIFSLIDACKNNSSELEKASHLLQILTMLEKKKPSSAEQKLIPETLQKILDDINDNFLEIRSIQDVLTRHFVSSATLTRWFRKYLHTTPRKYVESVRLSNAARLLSQGSSVTNACMQSGFSDCSHFIALFKKKFSQTPSKYKKK